MSNFFGDSYITQSSEEAEGGMKSARSSIGISG